MRSRGVVVAVAVAWMGVAPPSGARQRSSTGGRTMTSKESSSSPVTSWCCRGKYIVDSRSRSPGRIAPRSFRAPKAPAPTQRHRRHRRRRDDAWSSRGARRPPNQRRALSHDRGLRDPRHGRAVRANDTGVTYGRSGSSATTSTTPTTRGRECCNNGGCEVINSLIEGNYVHHPVSGRRRAQRGKCKAQRDPAMAMYPLHSEASRQHHRAKRDVELCNRRDSQQHHLGRECGERCNRINRGARLVVVPTVLADGDAPSAHRALPALYAQNGRVLREWRYVRPRLHAGVGSEADLDATSGKLQWPAADGPLSL